jgi:hypothetical protein
MVTSIYTDKKGIYKDLYRTIEAEKQPQQTCQSRERKGIYKDLYRTLETEKISFKANEKKEEKENIWHTYPLKICAYSNDVGEAIRPVIGAYFAKLSWIPAIFYIIGAILSKAFCSNSPEKSNELPKELSKEILFQGNASLLLPIILVKSVSKATHNIFDKFDWLHKLNKNQYRATCESAVGLFALAVAVKPIDYYTEKALDKIYSKS